MAASVSGVLLRIKQDLNHSLPPWMIESACRQAGHRWRERVLGPVMTLHLFVLQVLHANTAIRHLPHLANVPLNAAAYCRARMRLPLAALEQLLRSSVIALRQELITAATAPDHLTRWRGRRTYLTDGSSSIVPDEPALRRCFGQPKGREVHCGFPVAKVLGLFDAMTGLLVEIKTFALFVQDHACVWLLHPLLEAGDVLVGDRGVCSYAQLALLSERGAAALFRVRERRQIISFRPHRPAWQRSKSGGRCSKTQKGRPRSRFIRRLAFHDQLVAWLKPTPGSGPKWMSRTQFASLPDELPVREVRYRVDCGRGCRSREVTVVTTLLDAVEFPREAIAQLYGIRWQVETHWRELKTILRMRRLKCRTEAGVRKELAVYALVYNLVHAVMIKAANRQRTTPDRISFTDALRWLLSARPHQALGDLLVNPWRPGRHEPRVIKDHSNGYARMKQPRPVLRANLPAKWG
jgi:Transposase DDE domain.